LRKKLVFMPAKSYAKYSTAAAAVTDASRAAASASRFAAELRTEYVIQYIQARSSSHGWREEEAGVYSSANTVKIREVTRGVTFSQGFG